MLSIIILPMPIQGKVVHLLGVGGLLATVVLWELPGVWRQLEVLREFYDPDTVDLMRWIM